MKIIRVQQERIKENVTLPRNMHQPVISVKPYIDGELGNADHHNNVAILDFEGRVVAVIRYCPEQPLDGARVWIEAVNVKPLDD